MGAICGFNDIKNVVIFFFDIFYIFIVKILLKDNFNYKKIILLYFSFVFTCKKGN
jgi:hypothetical protein